MKSFKTAVILAVASVLLLLSACSSDKKSSQTTTKVVYGAGTDTSIIVKKTPYQEVIKRYIRCDSSVKAYKSYIPGPITIDTLHLTLQGERQEITVPAADTDKAGILPVPTTPTPDPDEKSGWDKFWDGIGSMIGWLLSGLGTLIGWILKALLCIIGAILAIIAVVLVVMCALWIISWLIKILQQLARWAAETFSGLFASSTANPDEERKVQPTAGPTSPVETATSNVVAAVTPSQSGPLASRKTTFNGTLVIEETFK